MSPVESPILLKELSLFLSEKVSHEIKASCKILQITVEEMPYQNAQKALTGSYYYGLFTSQKNNFLICIESNSLIFLTDRTLGGTGHIQTHAQLTQSELFLGSIILEWLLDFFGEKSIPTTIQRTETQNENIHAFFPDQVIHVATITLKFSSNLSSTLHCLYPMHFFNL